MNRLALASSMYLYCALPSVIRPPTRRLRVSKLMQGISIEQLDAAELPANTVAQ